MLRCIRAAVSTPVSLGVGAAFLSCIGARAVSSIIDVLGVCRYLQSSNGCAFGAAFFLCLVHKSKGPRRKSSNLRKNIVLGFYLTYY